MFIPFLVKGRGSHIHLGTYRLPFERERERERERESVEWRNWDGKSFWVSLQVWSEEGVYSEDDIFEEKEEAVL